MGVFELQDHSRATHGKIRAFLREVQRARVRALLLDDDGTLVPFCAEPSRAVPYCEMLLLLKRLQSETDTRLVIMSGRPAVGAARLLRLPEVEVWGCHGLERLKADGTLHRADVPAESLHAIAEATQFLMQEGLCDFAERKFASIAIHWRGKEALAGQLIRRVLRAWSTIQHVNGVRLLPFDGGIEIAAAIRNKGDAVQTVLEEIGPDAAVAYLGDDASDENAFEAIHGRGLSILVRRVYRRTLADVWVRPPDEVSAFFRGWIAACKDSG